MEPIEIVSIINNEPVIFIGIMVLLILSIFVAFTLAYIEIENDKT